MNRCRGFGVLVSAFWAFTAVPAQEGGTVEGRALNSVTHLPVEGAAVRLWSRNATNYVATTDSGGAFRIVGLKAGQYNFRFERAGFVDTEVSDPAKALRVGLAKDAIRLDVEMTPFASLAGRVLDSEGKPVAKVEVQTGLKFASTDEDGRFTFDNLAPGSYTVVAKPERKVSETLSPEGERVATLPTYFPSALDRGQAEAVSVAAGMNLTGFDIRLRSAVVYRIRGVVLDESGRPAEKAEVALSSRGEGVESMMQLSFGGFTQYVLEGVSGPEVRTVAGKDGAFEFPAVRPGEWMVSAELEGAWDPVLRHPKLRRGMENVQVGRQDVDHVEVQLAEPVDLPLEADWGDSPPGGVPGFPAVGLYGLEGGTALLVSGPVQVLPGRYRVTGGPPVNGYVPQSITLAGQDVLGQVVEIRPGSPPLRVVYKRSTTSLRGSVDKGSGSTILFWPQAANGPTVINTIKCGSNGNFESPVQPGDYYLLAVDRVDTHATADAAFLGKLIASATSVSVSEGATAQVQLPLTPWPQ